MRTSTRLLVAAVAALWIPMPALTAQEEDPRARIERELERKRELMRNGRLIRTNVRVTVRLKNRFRIRGVVKNGRFIEKVDGLDFVPADLQAPGAGLRVWYSDNTNSYIFIPYEELKHYKIGEKLTDEEVRAIELRIAEARREAEARRQAYLEQRRAKAAAKNGETSGAGEGGGEPEIKLDEKARALLEEFPPEAGWGADRVREIELRKITVGTYPDEKSRKFIMVFEDWLKANEVYQIQLRQAGVVRDEGGESGGAGGGAGSEKEKGGEPAKPPSGPGSAPKR